MRPKNGSAALKLLLVVVLLGAVAFAAWTRLTTDVVVAVIEPRGTATDAVSGSVEVAAEKGLQTLKVEAPGRVESCDALATGEAFEKGDLLLQLDTEVVKRAFAEYQRNYAAETERIAIQSKNDPRQRVAQRNFDEAKRAFADGFVAKEKVDEAERALAAVVTTLALESHAQKKLEADFEQQKATHELTLKKMRVVAPSDGRIKDVLVAPGALLSEGAPVATFYGNGREVLGKISEEDISKVKLGDPARVKFLRQAQEFDAKVIRILPFADAETHRYTVFLEVENAPLEQLIPNATGEVVITANEHKNAVLAPRRAIEKGKYVYVVKNGRVEKREIEMGYRGVYKAEILKGLEPQDVVVVENFDRLRDGQRVRVVNPK